MLNDGPTVNTSEPLATDVTAAEPVDGTAGWATESAASESAAESVGLGGIVGSAVLSGVLLVHAARTSVRPPMPVMRNWRRENAGLFMLASSSRRQGRQLLCADMFHIDKGCGRERFARLQPWGSGS
jgi:hypothetical protein